MKKLIIIPILVVISAIMIILIYQRQQASELPEDVIYSSGTVEAQEVSVSSQISAQVSRKLFRKGEFVEEGDTLFVFDDELLQARMGEIEAGMNAVEAEIRAARIDLENVKTNLERLREAYQAGSIPRSKLDDVETAYQAGQSRLKSLEAKGDQLEAQRKTLNVQLSYAVVTAPLAGLVQADPVDVGELAITGSTLVELVDLTDVWVEIYVNETDLPLVDIGDSAEVYLDVAPEKPFHGEVSFIAQEAEFTPKNIQTKKERTKLVFAVRVRVDNESRQFKPGLPADVYLRK